MNLLNFLKQFNGAQICGGNRQECLEEILIIMDVLNLKYTLNEKYIY